MPIKIILTLMFNRILLPILFAFSPFCIHAQINQISKDLHQALKKQSLEPISQYFLKTAQTIKVLSWPASPRTTARVDSMNKSYQDSLIRQIKKLNLNLKKKGFNLKKSKLIKVERSLGAFAQMTLYLSNKKKTATIYISVMDLNEKDYFLESYPSTSPKEGSNYSSSTMLNNKRYFLWHLRKSEIKKALNIIKKEEPIVFKGKTYPNYGWIGLIHGIITEEGKRYVYTKGFRAGDDTKIVIIVDLLKGEIFKIEKDIPYKEPQANPSDTLSLDDILNKIEINNDTSQVNKFILLRKKIISFNTFLDSLRIELVSQSGGYIEKDGRKIPKGKKDKETPHKIFITERKGNELKQKILQLEKDFINFFDDSKIKNIVKREITIGINESGPKERGKTWEEFTFGHMPIAAIFPMLRKFQNDVKTSEAVIIQLLLKEK
ncbi:hypothetical protein [Aureispira anguillae]|uniref:Gliding motility-associated protein GldM N-terminal domain-containing protein n=1 Tax=Aureispira anguillae TaxID=2864201 RepID=A0A915YEG0_9BACT|nr:hypothetical protein [Aureispira anguillae]BDS11508.1 hypothetical protein AsAng_0022220 [Aureispira anguillae]